MKKMNLGLAYVAQNWGSDYTKWPNGDEKNERNTKIKVRN